MAAAQKQDRSGAMKTEGVSRFTVHRRIDAVCTRLRRRQLLGSHATGLEVIRLLREVVAGAKFARFEQLCEHLSEVGDRLEAAGPKEPVIGNMVRRVLKFLREEYSNALQAHLVSQLGYVSSIPPTPGSFSSGIDTPDLSRSFSSLAMASTRLHAHPFSSLTSASSSSSPLPTSSTFHHAPPLSQSSTSSAGDAAPSGHHSNSASSFFDLLGHRAPDENKYAFGGGAETALGADTPLGISTPESTTSPPSRAGTPPPAIVSVSGSPRSYQNPSRRGSFGFGSAAAANAERERLGLGKKTLDALENEFSNKAGSLKPIFIEAIQELYDELEMVGESVANQAGEHVHSSEIIMTMDHSRTVEAFLKSAAKKRKFAVVVAETAPSFTGRTLARSLSSAGSTSSSDPSPSIPTLLIPDSSIFALMSRCSKVVIGCHAVLADGSLLARSGSLGLCRSAKAHLVPVVVVCGMYKFSPVYSLGAGGGTGKGGFGARAGTDLASSDLKSPEEVLREEEVLGWQDAGDGKGQVEVLNPYYDRVPSELVSLFITNLGGHPSSLIYRLLTDLYG